MATVLDYSAGRPSGQAVADAAHLGVVRYIGTPGRKKNLTRAEFLDLDAHGRGVALVYENHAGDAAGGYAAGVRAAQAARADADACGYPQHRPIYFAIDSDQLTPAQFRDAMSYLDGAASVLGQVDLTGVYGEYDVIEMAVGEHARYGWQTAAWSKGKRSAKASLYQRIGLVKVGGVDCDVSEVLVADWGQHNYTAIPAVSTVEDDMAFGAQAKAGTGQHTDIGVAGCKKLRIHTSFSNVVKVRAILFYGDTGKDPKGTGVGGGYDGEFRTPKESWNWDPNRPGPVVIPDGATTCTVLHDAGGDFYISAAAV